ncbi:hypothetical protein [Kitasatospora sp. NPDC004272]
MTTRLAAALTAMAAVVAMAGVAATPAQATEGPNPYWYTGIIRSWAQGQCLDSNDKGDVYTLPCNGGQYQQWHITIKEHPKDQWATVWIQDVQTQRFLAPICDTCDSWQPGVSTVGWLTDGWLLFPSNDPWTAWRFAWNPGPSQRCLDANSPGSPPYISFTDWHPDPRLPPTNYCSSNFQDWKLGF